MKREKINNRKVVIVNQASNYLTVGLCNAFAEQFETVHLITGSIHVQGEELNDSVRVRWINHWIEKPARKKLASYLIACFKIYWLLLVRYRNVEVFFISLPPMAYLLSIILSHRCSMLIWDVYPDLFKITGLKETHLLYRLWAWLNKKAFKKAFRLFTIGKRMAGLLKKYAPKDKVIITPIWSIFQTNNKINKNDNPFLVEHDIREKFIVQYSGNIGLTHNVEVMIELAALMKGHDDILFQIIGRGPREPALKTLVKKRNLPNCQFLPFQSDEMFPYSLSAADIGVVILDELTSKGSVPSKSYNLMSYGIPALYMASDDSELHDYAIQYQHATCVNHTSLDKARDFILQLRDSKERYDRYAKNAVKASANYRRSNADRIVELYLHSEAEAEKIASEQLVAQSEESIELQ